MYVNLNAYVRVNQHVFISLHFPAMKSLWLSHMPRGAFPKCQTLRHLGDWDTFGGLLEWFRTVSHSCPFCVLDPSTFVKFNDESCPSLTYLQEVTWWTLRVGETPVLGRGTKDLRTPINAVGTNDSKY